MWSYVCLCRWFFKKDKVVDILIPALAEFVGSAFFIFMACGAGMNTVNFSSYAVCIRVISACPTLPRAGLFGLIVAMKCY
jgi:hypothetical protein